MCCCCTQGPEGDDADDVRLQVQERMDVTQKTHEFKFTFGDNDDGDGGGGNDDDSHQVPQCAHDKYRFCDCK